MLKSIVILTGFLCLLQMELSAQADSSDFPVKEKKKKGWTWAALPVVAYDADQGLQLGALGQIFTMGTALPIPSIVIPFMPNVPGSLREAPFTSFSMIPNFLYRERSGLRPMWIT